MSRARHAPAKSQNAAPTPESSSNPTAQAGSTPPAPDLFAPNDTTSGFGDEDGAGTV